MEGMVTDLQLARDKQQNFDEWKREHAADKPLTMDLTVTVLTTGFWPSYKVNTWNGMLLLVKLLLPSVLTFPHSCKACMHLLYVFLVEQHSNLYPTHAVHKWECTQVSANLQEEFAQMYIFDVIAACGSCTATRDD